MTMQNESKNIPAMREWISASDLLLEEHDVRTVLDGLQEQPSKH